MSETVTVECLSCLVRWQVPRHSHSPGYDYDLIACICPNGHVHHGVTTSAFMPATPWSRYCPRHR